MPDNTCKPAGSSLHANSDRHFRAVTAAPVIGLKRTKRQWQIEMVGSKGFALTGVATVLSGYHFYQPYYHSTVRNCRCISNLFISTSTYYVLLHNSLTAVQRGGGGLLQLRLFANISRTNDRHETWDTLLFSGRFRGEVSETVWTD